MLRRFMLSLLVDTKSYMKVPHLLVSRPTAVGIEPSTLSRPEPSNGRIMMQWIWRSDLISSMRYLFDIFKGFLSRAQLLQTGFQFGGIDFGALMNSCVLNCNSRRDRQRFREAKMFGCKNVWRVRSKRQNAEYTTRGDQWYAEPG